MKAFNIQTKLFSCLKTYDKKTFMSDLMAGIIVGIVALPLAIAFGIASGVTPEKGIITAIVAGLVISLFGGSKVQIGGPTGAFIIIIYGIVHVHPTVVVNAFVMGLVLAFIYLRTDSLWSAIILHAINNGIAYLALIAGHGNSMLIDMVGSRTLYVLLYIAALAVFAVFVNVAIFCRTLSTFSFGARFNGSKAIQQFVRVNTVSDQHFAILLQFTSALFNFSSSRAFFFATFVNNNF
jgi:MFS superfamily sulfate permease-like transporter